MQPPVDRALPQPYRRLQTHFPCGFAAGCTLYFAELVCPPCPLLQARLVVLGTVASTLTAWGLRRCAWRTWVCPHEQCQHPLAASTVFTCLLTACSPRSLTTLVSSSICSAAPTQRQPRPLAQRPPPTSSSLACEWRRQRLKKAEVFEFGQLWDRRRFCALVTDLHRHPCRTRLAPSLPPHLPCFPGPTTLPCFPGPTMLPCFPGPTMLPSPAAP